MIPVIEKYLHVFIIFYYREVFVYIFRKPTNAVKNLRDPSFVATLFKHDSISKMLIQSGTIYNHICDNNVCSYKVSTKL